MAGVAAECPGESRPGTRFVLAARTERGGPPRRSRTALHRHHALYQYHSRVEAASLSRQPRNRAADQKHHPLERHGDGRPGQQGREPGHRRPHLHLRLGRHAVRSGLQSFLPRQGRRLFRRSDLFSGARGAGHLRPGVSRRPADRTTSGEFPPRDGRRRRAVQLSASLADAQFLGVSDRLDGSGADHGHLPGPVQSSICKIAESKTPPARTSGRFWATAKPTSRKRWAPSRWAAAKNSTI